MAIKRIKVKNFKSFDELDLELHPFNVVIGANASGKSNFTQIFKFLKDVEENGLSDGVSMHGGAESLLNLKIGYSDDLTVEAVLDIPVMWGPAENVLTTKEIRYRISAGLTQEEDEFGLVDEEIALNLQCTKLRESEKGFFEEDNLLWQGEVVVSNKADGPSYDFKPPSIEERLREIDLLPSPSRLVSLFGEHIPRSTLLIRTPFSLLPPWQSLFAGIGVYDIDPHLAREHARIVGRLELEENGSNLALVVAKILENAENKRKFTNLLKELLPFAEEIGTEKIGEKSLLIHIREQFYKEDLKAYLLSDGTINITAMIAALYFESKNVVILEEPERNIHPHLISRVVDMMKDASQNKQVIVTTHSPELVKHAGIENLLLVSRDKDGFTKVVRPSEREQLKMFLESELGLDELFIQNILAG